jgi:hypothetical protein
VSLNVAVAIPLAFVVVTFENDAPWLANPPGFACANATVAPATGFPLASTTEATTFTVSPEIVGDPVTASDESAAENTSSGVTELEAAEAGPGPSTLDATTVNVYETPSVNPVTTWLSAVDPAFESTPPAGLDVTVYPVIAEPPFDAGALNVTVACAFPAVAVPMTGAPGVVEGVTAFEFAEFPLLPTALVATTVKRYDVPFTSPVTTWLSKVDPALESVPPAGWEVTVYPVIGEPPFAAAANVTVACALPAVATTLVGAEGFVAGVTEFDGADAAPVPCALVAVTVNV